MTKRPADVVLFVLSPSMLKFNCQKCVSIIKVIPNLSVKMRFSLSKTYQFRRIKRWEGVLKSDKKISLTGPKIHLQESNKNDEK
jgi:hypothetical protein